MTATPRPAAPTTGTASTRGSAGSRLPAAGLFAVVLGAALVASLQFLASTEHISAIRRTISEYALTENKWLFDLGVFLVAAGSAAVFAGLHRRGLLTTRAPALVFAGLWTVALLAIVVFPKHDWAVGPSVGGDVHRVASIIAFLSLPLAVLGAAGSVYADSPRLRVITRLTALSTLLWFVPIIIAVVRMATGGEAWWRAIPLGLVERLMAVNGLLAIVLLAAGSLLGRATVRQVTA